MTCGHLFFFFACPKKKQKKTPTKDYIAFVGRFPDLTLYYGGEEHWFPDVVLLKESLFA